MKPLCDPKNDRMVKTIKPPPHKPLDSNLLWSNPKNKKLPNWKTVRDHLKKEGKLLKTDIRKLINISAEVFKKEGNLVQLQDPITVVGDIHGQFYDLIKLLNVGGNPENTKYLFLGDFVDRGSFSTEVMFLILSLKLNFPKSIFLLRGNHECRQMTQCFNFRTECLTKYDQEIYELFMFLFDTFPLSAIINGKFIAFHGGISPELKNIKDLNKINRFKEPPKSGIFCDILWSDPVDKPDGALENPYVFNNQRGCSYIYGAEALSKFLHKNHLLSLIRAHEVQLEGFKMYNWKSKSFPQIITIFSAPNYCDTYNNKGAVIKFENNSLNIQQFHYSPHPYYLPNFMNIFSWSMPFVSEKTTEIIFNILNKKDLLDDDDDIAEGKVINLMKNTKLAKLKKNKGIMKNKLQFVSQMLKMQTLLREESEKIIKIKQMNNNKLPQGILLEGKKALESFTLAKKKDFENEKRPY